MVHPPMFSAGSCQFILVAALAAIAAAPACRDRRPAPPAVATVTHVHPNGLVLTIPDAIGTQRLAVDRTPTGFSVHGEPGNARTPTSARVTLNAGAATPPGVWPKARTVRGATIRYAVVTFPEVGSGGPEYELRAWEPARTGHIAYLQHVQTEGEPDFAIAWAVIEGTKLSP